MRAGGRVEAGRGVDKRGLDRFELSRGTYVETRPRNINSAPSSLLSLSKYLPAIFLIPLPLVKRPVSLITYLSKSNEPPPRSSRNSPIPGSRRFLKAFFSPFSLRLKSVEEWIRSSRCLQVCRRVKFLKRAFRPLFDTIIEDGSVHSSDLGQWIRTMHRFESIQATGIDDNSSASYPLIRRESYYTWKVLIALCGLATFPTRKDSQFQNFAQLFPSTAFMICCLLFTSSNLFSKQNLRNASFSSQLLSPIPHNVKDSSISRRTAIFCGKKKKIRSPTFQNVSECGASASLASTTRTIHHSASPMRHGTRVGIICSLD